MEYSTEIAEKFLDPAWSTIDEGKFMTLCTACTNCGCSVLNRGVQFIQIDYPFLFCSKDCLASVKIDVYGTRKLRKKPPKYRIFQFYYHYELNDFENEEDRRRIRVYKEKMEADEQWRLLQGKSQSSEEEKRHKKWRMLQAKSQPNEQEKRPKRVRFAELDPDESKTEGNDTHDSRFHEVQVEDYSNAMFSFDMACGLAAYD